MSFEKHLLLMEGPLSNASVILLLVEITPMRFKCSSSNKKKDIMKTIRKTYIHDFIFIKSVVSSKEYLNKECGLT